MTNFLLNLLKKVTKTLEGTGIGKIKPLFKIYAFLLSYLKPRMVVTEGSKMYLDKNDSLLLSVYPNFEPAETKLIKRWVKSGMVVVDAGAHIGYFTLLMAKLVGQTGKVHSFEPGKENFTLLKKNVQVNNYKNVVLNQTALSNKVGKVRLYISDDNPQDHRIIGNERSKKYEVVETTTLDRYFGNSGKVEFVKMDIQGAEVLALEGGRRLLSNNKGLKMIIEFWPFVLKRGGVDSKKFFDKLQTVGLVKLIDERDGKLIENFKLDFSGQSENKLYNLLIQT